ncbi:electron transport complex protein RnfG [Sulfuritortus calidifontis]|uniref:Ion-translocating oxidoreductase complex subunit G n=1 Tax=Sulfuritortus calidifontis TaxID=1914471 RepID=A0A4R3K080_9PROT|nr:electron transport complex subunit RsxG [Sulfuritortus calidifontis]TCS72976.1 electron transport complex protein RnfG [Sulfuritortus calidifontis]
MKAMVRAAITTALALLVFSAIGTVLLSGTYSLTLDTITRSEQATRQILIAQTLPEGSFDNNLVAEAMPLALDPLLGGKKPGLAYPARLNGKPVAVVIEATAPDGYAGEIKLLIGILADGRLGGVRVAQHKETPGLGDYIELKKNPWIRQFDGLSLGSMAEDQWRVRKDGGRFDYMAGATITPRAIVKAVHKALRYFELHKAELLKPSSEVTA